MVHVMNIIPGEKVWTVEMWTKWVQLRNEISIEEEQYGMWNEVAAVWIALKEAVRESR